MSKPRNNSTDRDGDSTDAVVLDFPGTLGVNPTGPADPTGPVPHPPPGDTPTTTPPGPNDPPSTGPGRAGETTASTTAPGRALGDRPADVVGENDHDDDGAPGPTGPGRPSMWAGPGTTIELADEPVDAELVDPAEDAEVDARLQRARTRPEIVVRQVGAQVGAVVRVGVTHQHTRRAGRTALRAIVHIAQGHASWAKRATDALTHAHVREQIRAARAGGKLEELADWTDRLAQLKQARTERLRNLPTTVKGLAITALVGIAVAGGLLLVLGIVFAVSGAMGWDAWWNLVGFLFRAVAILTAWAIRIAAGAALPALAIFAYREGKRRGVLPAWAISPEQRAAENMVVTPAGISEALAHLRIAPLDRAFKDGWTVPFDTAPVRVNNRGYHAVFELPIGVTLEMVADKRTVFARNLRRDTIEVWPTKATRAGYIDLWVADAGSASKPAPAYPLLTEGVCDVFAGVPLGVSQRGDVIAPPLVEANMVFGGLPGQGKSNAVRVVMLGAALDPLAELWVFVFAGNGDFDVYRPRLARYERGTGSDVAEAAMRALQELYDEVGRREERLADLGVKKLTRALAAQHPDLRPIVAAFSECHELFGHPEFGKLAGELAVNIVKRGRKAGIVTLYDTQSSRAAAIPPALVENVAINTCFYVKTWRNNDGFLGDGSFQAGIRATELRFKVDRGTSVSTGTTEETFELLKWFYIQADDTGYDAADEVIARSLGKVHPKVPIGGRSLAEVPVLDKPRDLLDDLDEVLSKRGNGTDKVRIADVPPLLRDLAPTWAPYQNLTGTKLREILRDSYGIKVPSTNREYPLDPVTVREAVARLATADLDAED